MILPVGDRPMLRMVRTDASGPSSARIERALANAPGVTPVPVGLTHPVHETICHLFSTARAGQAVVDVRAHGELADPAFTTPTTPDEALSGAEAAMYVKKANRRAARRGSSGAPAGRS